MATGVIHAGACGFTINVKAVSDEDNKVQLKITSVIALITKKLRRN